MKLQLVLPQGILNERYCLLLFFGLFEDYILGSHSKNLDYSFYNIGCDSYRSEKEQKNSY